MKKILKILIYFLIALFLNTIVYANESTDFGNIYKEQYKISKAEALPDKLPKESAKILEDIGIKSPEWKNFENLSIEKIFKKISDVTKEKFYSPFASFVSVIFVILLYAIISNLKNSFGSKEISKIMGIVSTICLSSLIIYPVTKCINNSSVAIQNAAEFTIYSVPIISVIMGASGHALSATSYQTLVMIAGQAISYVSKFFLVPFINALFGISIISSISSNLNLDSLCKTICKFLKTLLKFISYIFTSILALQNLVTHSADNLGINALKFAIDSCVPIVGGTLSDSFSTVHACIKLLKSGVGAFGILACAAIFLPVVAECFAWIIFLNISTSVVNVFGLKKINSIFESTKNIISINLAVILCSLSVLTVSCFILILIGR